jgi:hypothetical protein
VTEEQIAKLQGLTHECSMGLPPCECDIPEALGDAGRVSRQIAPLPVLQRLLEERRVLLEAAALVVKGRHCDEAGCTHRACCQAAIARTAIAFAEEAAP